MKTDKTCQKCSNILSELEKNFREIYALLKLDAISMDVVVKLEIYFGRIEAIISGEKTIASKVFKEIFDNVSLKKTFESEVGHNEKFLNRVNPTHF